MGSSTPSTGTVSSPPDAGTGTAPLRLLVVNWHDRLHPQAGGAEVHLHEVFSRLARAGHRVGLLVSGWPGAPRRERVDGLEVHRTGRRHTFPGRVIGAYRRLRDRGYDLVVEDINKLPLYTPLWVDSPVVGLVPHLFGTTAFREASWPVAATVWLAERLLPRVYGSVPFQVISESTRDDLRRRGIPGSRVEVIHPGVDHESYHPDPSASRYPSPTFVHVGRLKRYKGLEVPIRALARLKRSGLEARLLVAGRGDDRPRLERVRDRHGLGEAVEFLGYVSEERKVELYRRAWANLYPSPKEGWGLTAVEAAACGTPTVASDAPGLRESVVDGRTGFLVPHADEEAWSERLGRLARDRELRRRLAQGAVDHAGRFSWDRTARETERSLLSLREALARRAPGRSDPGAEGSRASRR